MISSFKPCIAAAVVLTLAPASTLFGQDLAYYDAGRVIPLESLEVVGTRTAAVDPTAQKLAVPVKDTPRSLSVIDATRMREQDFQVGSDLLLWVPGISTNGAVQESYHYYARGFRMGPNDWRVDGFSGRVLGGSYSPNLFGYEQVTVLKGPAGLLYGSAGAPGGMINLVTKKPQETAAVSIDSRTRTFAGKDSAFGDRVSGEIETDATGPVTKECRLLYRFLSSAEQTALPYHGQTDANQFYRLSFTYKLDRAGRFQMTPLFEWSEESRAARNPVISPASSRTTNDGRTDYTTSDVSPPSVNLAAGERVDRNRIAGLDINLSFSDEWSVSISARQQQRDMNNSAWSIQPTTLTQLDPVDAESWVISRRHARSKSAVATTSIDANTTYQFADTGWLKSRAQLGFNARIVENQAFAFTPSNLNQSPINIYTGLASSPLVADVPPTYAVGNLTRTTSWNTYAQSQTEVWRRLVATISLATAKEKSRTDVPNAPVLFPPERSSNLTPNVGLVYRITPNVSAFASYSTSYTLADPLAENAAGDTGGFKPTEGESLEAGLKGEFFNHRLSSSVAVFETELNRVLVQSDLTELNAKGNRFYRQLDTGRKSEGVEVELGFRPLPEWENNLTYAYVDAYDRKVDGSAGSPAEMTPKHSVSLYSRYTFTSGALQHWTVRLGFIWQSDRIGGSAAPSATAPDPLVLRSFHRFDAGVSRRWEHWNIAINIENLTDEYFLLAGNTGVAMSPTNPRSLALRVGYGW